MIFVVVISPSSTHLVNTVMGAFPHMPKNGIRAWHLTSLCHNFTIFEMLSPSKFLIVKHCLHLQHAVLNIKYNKTFFVNIKTLINNRNSCQRLLTIFITDIPYLFSNLLTYRVIPGNCFFFLLFITQAVRIFETDL